MPIRRRLRIFALVVAAIVAAERLPTAMGVVCFDCFDTGPTNADCTWVRNCTGIACLLYEAGDNRTSTAFCLLTMRGVGMEARGNGHEQQQDGCWLEPDGRGKHCICRDNFCNRLRDRTTANNDPLTMPLPHASFLKKNPLIDYDDVDVEADLGLNSRPIPENLLFPGAAEIDQAVAGGGKKKVELGDHDDLVPIDITNYDYDPDSPPSSNNNRANAYHSSPGQMVEDRSKQQTRLLLTPEIAPGEHRNTVDEPDSTASQRVSLLHVATTVLVQLVVVQRLL